MYIKGCEKQGSKLVTAVVAIGRVYLYSHAETIIENCNFYSKF
jgi:hypothetical protein